MQGKFLNRMGHFGRKSGGGNCTTKAVDVLLAIVGLARFRGGVGSGESPAYPTMIKTIKATKGNADILIHAFFKLRGLCKSCCRLFEVCKLGELSHSLPLLLDKVFVCSGGSEHW